MSDSQGQDITEGQTVGAMSTPEQPGDELPEDASERTRAAFEKLKLHNKALAQKLAESSNTTSLLDDLPVQGQAVTAPAGAGATQLFDVNGYVDPVILNNQIAQSQRKADEAVKRAQDAEKRIQEFEKTQLVREAQAKYPQLDPNSDNFDPLFFDAVKNELTGQTSRGQKRDIFSAAKKVETFYHPKPKSNETEVKREKIVTSRQQASAQTGTTKGSSTAVDRDQLIAGTRRGDPDAIFKRLQASGF